MPLPQQGEGGVLPARAGSSAGCQGGGAWSPQQVELPAVDAGRLPLPGLGQVQQHTFAGGERGLHVGSIGRLVRRTRRGSLDLHLGEPGEALRQSRFGTVRNLVLLGGSVTVDPASGNVFNRVTSLRMRLQVPEPAGSHKSY